MDVSPFLTRGLASQPLCYQAFEVISCKRVYNSAAATTYVTSDRLRRPVFVRGPRHPTRCWDLRRIVSGEYVLTMY